jgi:hypothetical protein
MLSAVAVCLLLPPLTAARADDLRRENARLEREVGELRLDAMEFRYRSGLSVPVGNMAGGVPIERTSSRPRGADFSHTRDYYDSQLHTAMRPGPPTPEAHTQWLRILILIEKMEAYQRQRDDLERRGLVRRSIDPDRFPVLADLNRRNSSLKFEKRTAELELKQLRSESAIRPTR